MNLVAIIELIYVLTILTAIIYELYKKINSSIYMLLKLKTIN